MLKLIKGSYSATCGLFRFLGQGTELLGEGLKEFGKGMETIAIELENVTKELLETSNFKLYIHQLKLCRLTIENKQKYTSTKYKNLHRFYNLCKEPTDVIIDLLQIAIDQPNHRHLVQNIVDQLKTNIASFFNENEEWKIELEELCSKGLHKNSNLLDAIFYSFEVSSNDELEKEAKLMLPELIKSWNSATKELDNLRRSIIET